MANVVPFQQQNVALPAHIAKFLADNSNIDPKQNIPQLSFRGKVWRIVLDGEETTVTKDEEPVSTIRVVVIDHNKARSRSYYEGAYEEGKATMPACFSIDGVVPDDAVESPQAETCANCPQSVKGSKITPTGKEVTACSSYKRAVVVPHADLSFTPLLLRIPQTSMWDKHNEENEAKGWYAWDQYLDMLRQRGAAHTSVVLTKIKFDARVAYPKLLFAAHDFVSGEDLATVSKLFDTPEVNDLLKAPETSAASRAPKDAPAVAAPKAKGKGKQAAPPPPDDDDDEADDEAEATGTNGEEEGFDDDPPAAPPAPATGKGKRRAAPPPPEPEEDDGDGEVALPTRGKPARGKPTAAPTPAAATGKGKGKPPANSGLGSLMNEWEV